MADANKMGMNRTGMDMSPKQSEAMLKGSEMADAGPAGRRGMDQIRQAYFSEGDTVGSVPLPGSFSGALSSVKEKLQGNNPEVLINKLGQRLAFERAGVRLYEALIYKCQTSPDDTTSEIISVDSLKQFRNDEAEHFLLVHQIMESLGADPTAMTPDADVTALSSLGVSKVLTEPRTSVLQCLEAIQTVELTDNAAWTLLQELCLNMGLDDMAKQLTPAIEQEEIHAHTITQWIRQIAMKKGAGKALDSTDASTTH
ncbi:ferritin-like domain-containing protein [Marinimicrobium sp. ABcell2]|uniref:ferritin-like domain-containing protein n=1 Tax=Marinimicrobium sp. ABcell2 TaxID=3069751 RepID=UPI0027B7783E|nr:ferritin-like domain-containing protein [Marinimicrobium sp. ABcell2]MDQ2078509.1 ferritin-like domain-containing protein [Marinimicrobium sp. ABcell2]